MACQIVSHVVAPIIGLAIGLAWVAQPEPCGVSACTSAPGVTQIASCTAGGCASLGDVKAWVVEHGAAARRLGLPMLDCMVGEIETHCPFDAYAASVEKGVPAEYRLGAAVYTDITEACGALVRAMDAFLVEITSVSDGRADATAKGAAGFRVAGSTFECPIEATDAAARATEAAQSVVHLLSVGGQECCCERMAAAMSAQSGSPVVHHVAGLAIQCEIQAGIVESIARIEAALSQVESTHGG